MRKGLLGLAVCAGLASTSLISSGAQAAPLDGGSLRAALEEANALIAVTHRCYRRWNGYSYEIYCPPHGPRYKPRPYYHPRPYYNPYRY